MKREQRLRQLFRGKILKTPARWSDEDEPVYPGAEPLRRAWKDKILRVTFRGRPHRNSMEVAHWFQIPFSEFPEFLGTKPICDIAQWMVSAAGPAAKVAPDLLRKIEIEVTDQEEYR
ncbi:hypothetical protein J3R74_000261 [Puniceicoccus vermicola]|uniref:Uncharacterized protein n=1 Tax=Puniceicoccus vermicola TaxID=388746 RepID=A0A7X1E478_9BACT|nr:hypothetical protein [Puniceicoccus vermicola]MBC2601759.1 hypothetical protein [Puniceicoccus vermicola]